MQYGLCHLSLVPVRLEPSDTSELVTQLLYGDCFKIIDERKKWFKIRIAFDLYEGWIDKKQAKVISENNYQEFSTQQLHSADLVDVITLPSRQALSICLGSNIAVAGFLDHQFDGQTITNASNDRNKIAETALMYLNAPYLWGGKSPFGIDCSGFTQMVYKINQHQLYRDASQQAKQGETLSFIEESKPGDLAFFDNQEGRIIHVGIILGDNYIIHAHGHVRIDRLDHTGIFNTDARQYSHQLRVIKNLLGD